AAHREAEAAADAGLALDAEVAAHQPHQLARDREAEAAAAIAPRGRAVGLAEALEEPAERLGGDSDPGVEDLEGERDRALVGGLRAEGQRHRALGGELDRVADEVEE